jgi:hypothetical protein
MRAAELQSFLPLQRTQEQYKEDDTHPHVMQSLTGITVGMI